jgi:hypothetical protein
LDEGLRQAGALPGAQAERRSADHFARHTIDSRKTFCHVSDERIKMASPVICTEEEKWSGTMREFFRGWRRKIGVAALL